MVVVEYHHQVLTHWAKYRSQLRHAPLLLTLDHHTDTSPAFRTHLGRLIKGSPEFFNQQKILLSNMKFKNLASIDEAIQKLAHDEHITAAIQTDIISSAFVVAQNARDTDLNVFQEHRICCFSAQNDQLLESAFLLSAFRHFFKVSPFFDSADLFFKQDYILDIDLDYLTTYSAVEPKDASFLKALARHAGLVTIAKETHHVSLCAIDQGLTADHLLLKLQQLLS